jgi:hypothetical protein
MQCEEFSRNGWKSIVDGIISYSRGSKKWLRDLALGSLNDLQTI